MMKRRHWLATLLAACAAILLRAAGVVEALPRNNNPKQESNSLASTPGASGRGSRGGAGNGRLDRRQLVGSGGGSRDSVSLHDSFPCESDQQSSPPPSNASGSSAASAANDRGPATASTPNYLNINSFMAQNNIDVTNPPATVNTASESPALNTRGGATINDKSGDPSLDDDMIDQMVDDLIAEVDGEDESGESEVDEDEAEDEDEDEEQEIEGGESSMDEVSDTGEEAEPDDENIREMDTTSNVEESSSNPIPTNRKDGPPDPIQPSSRQSSALPQRRGPTQSSSLSIPTTPTNAFYRFLVRRGPKGHVLAAFTLIAVQWIYVYVPAVYQSVASTLLKLRIYNPQVLYEKDRQRQMRMKYGPPKREKGGLTSKLFGSSKTKPPSASQQRKAMQKRADEDAAEKLKQLYKTMKIGSGVGMLSEVKYRYLSVAFRKRHGLGKEFRIEKPRTFMGEVVEGSVGGSTGISNEVLDGGMDADEIVFSDDESVETVEGSGQGVPGSDTGVGQTDRGQKGAPRQQQRVKRKKIDDWVVKAFVTSPQRSGPPNHDNSVKPPPSLWATVERRAILDAAWESRAAEQLATTPKGGRRGGDSHGSKTGKEPLGNDIGVETAAASGDTSSGGYGASKMFQSVMTRVGSNGRIFGAYPNDALPIEECANEKGVIQLARRYGYGDWRASDEMGRYGQDFAQNHDDEDENDTWGGGDLVFGQVEDSETLPPTGASNRGRRRKRKKKQPFSTSKQDDIDYAVVKSKKRRRSRKGSAGSHALGLSGGGMAVDAPRAKEGFTFELGVRANASEPKKSLSDMSAKASPKKEPPRQRDLGNIRSQLQKQSSILFTSDTNVKAPTELLNRLGKNEED